jgi:hypothetical protein
MEFTLRELLTQGGWTVNSLNNMTSDQKRNTVIQLLSDFSTQPVGYYQGLSDNELVDRGAILMILRNIVSDDALKQMSDDQQRNSIIVALNSRTDKAIGELQGKSNRELAQIGFGIITDSKLVSAILQIDWNVDSAKVLETAPEIIESQTFINKDSQIDIKETFSFSKEVESKYSLSLTGEYKIGGEVTIEGGVGIPVLAEGKAGVKIDSSLTLGAAFGTEEITKQKYERTSEVTVSPNTSIKMSAIITRGKMNVPYKALIRTSIGEEKWTEGLWEGTSTSDLVVKREPITMEEKEFAHS